MKPTLIIQIVVSIILVVLITIQSKDSSLGQGFGGVTQKGFHTKRGPEKLIYLLTVILGVIFVLISLINIV